MTTHIISSRREAEMVLTSGCEALIGLLMELQALHGAMDGPERTLAESEAEEVLRLRKVYFHVQAITSWTVETHVLHVMAPDIRAAQEHLYPLTLEDLYDNDKQSASNARRKRDRILDPLSHPTPMILIYRPHLGGLGSDNIWEFIEFFFC